MRKINLQEWQRSAPLQLSADEHDALLGEAKTLDLSIEPVAATESEYRLWSGSTIGALEIGDLSVLIEPKIGLPQVISLACYAIGKVKFQREDFDFPDEYALPDALALTLASHARRAFARGLLHGYRTEEEALYTVRGRIRFDEQLRRQFGISLPVEVQYDEFTADVLANRLVKAAAYRLGRVRLRSAEARRNLGWVTGMLEDVSLVEYPSTLIPAVSFDRLNGHYRGVVELARLILRHGAFESGRGKVRASGFLMDMNVVFQEFITVALREQLGVSPHEFGEKSIPSLDDGERIQLRPDLTWRQSDRCVFVGDAKYKKITHGSVPNADLYQLLAYATAADLPGGLLIYAEGEAQVAVHTVRRSGKRLEVAALKLSGSLDDVLADVARLAGRVVALRSEARRQQPHAAILS